MTTPIHDPERDKLLLEWMRSNEAFKTLARTYGKGGRPALHAEPEPMAAPPAPLPEVDLDARQEALIGWLHGNEAFKSLAKKYGRTYPRPEPKP